MAKSWQRLRAMRTVGVLLLAVLVTVVYRLILGRGFRMLKDNIFKKIIDKQLPARIVHEDEHCLAFHDIHPQAPVHVLIIPKKEIPTHEDIALEDQALLGHIHVVAQKLARELGLNDGYRLVLNCLDQGGQTVPHLHLHLLGGRPMAWPPG